MHIPCTHHADEKSAIDAAVIRLAASLNHYLWLTTAPNDEDPVGAFCALADADAKLCNAWVQHIGAVTSGIHPTCDDLLGIWIAPSQIFSDEAVAVACRADARLDI